MIYRVRSGGSYFSQLDVAVIARKGYLAAKEGQPQIGIRLVRVISPCQQIAGAK